MHHEHVTISMEPMFVENRNVMMKLEWTLPKDKDAL